MSGRRTLQSGFSLMSRGEPKIWLTGGMLVICLLMIISLLSLIIVNGLATFWPGPVHWLVLSQNELEIGEPQRQEVRASGDGTSKEQEPSYFYRTANFDITNRHYRWLQPQELVASGITVPEWALVIERYEWGRMYAIPSRLTMPAHWTEAEPGGQELSRSLACQNLLTELASELEPLAAIEPTIPLDSIIAALTQRIANERTSVLQALMRQAIESKSGHVQAQTEENGPWQPVTETDNTFSSLAAVHSVIDRPQEILERFERLHARLEDARSRTRKLMHQISMLDSQLSEARIAVHQAELDTGKTVLDQLDIVGPLIDGVVNHTRTMKRLETVAQSSRKLMTDPALAKQLEELITRYQQQTLKTLGEAFQSELDAWQQQFADAPPQIQQATQRFAQVWREVVEKKAPLEEQLQTIEAETVGFELNVMVPTGAQQLELTEADSQSLLKGEWTENSKNLLAAQGFELSATAPTVANVQSQLKTLSFDTVSHGQVTLWCVEQKSSSPVWLVPAQKSVQCSEIVRLFPANRLSAAGKLGIYLDRWREFLLSDPREGNTEGGVFPAIWGTVVMTLIMTLAVVPFGVIAALYLREYTRSGPIVSLVRISINNLAGVPSIVYGVFGLAFFCYSMGAFIDGGARNAQFGVLPANSWYLTLAGTALVGLVAFMFSLMSGGRDRATNPWKRRMAAIAPLAWLVSLAGLGVLIFKSPYFDGFYEARLPTPTFGKEGLLWASFTLALLTLPVVIVATEEALSAVPNSLREGSLACGASKWQTIYRIVLPHARPGILTGAILAMARGIGEVAPLMLVGALPVAPDLPLDSEFPYFHGSRSFMHLGYQIYWLGFQSQNSEASKPLVFTCTLLLILIVISLNLSAILLRARLRKRFQGNQF